MSWKLGQILRMKDFKFEDDGSTRDKYGIVINSNETEAYLLLSLTTTKDKGYPVASYGCHGFGHLHYYFIPAEQVVGDDGYYFDEDTYIFFRNNVRRIEFEKIEQIKSKSPFGVVPLGALSKAELLGLIDCILLSRDYPVAMDAELRLIRVYVATL